MPSANNFSNNHRPFGGPGFPGENLNGTELRRSNLQSPWAQVVRGESVSPVDQSPLSSSSSLSSLAASVTETSFSDCTATKAAPASPPPDNLASSESYDSNDGNATAPMRKPAWNKPSNGVVEAGPVMGAVSWPALSESARASPRLAVDSPINPAAGGSVPTSQEPVSVPPERPSSNNARSNSTPKHPMAARQRSSRRGGGNSVGGPARGGYIRPPLTPPPPPCPVYQIPHSSYNNLIPAISDPSSGDPLYVSNNWDPRPVAGFVPQTNAGTDHRNFFPRGNFGLHHRGDGHYHNNRGGNRNHDRGMYPNARDVHLQHHRPPPRGFVRHSPSYPAQFSQPIRPHGNFMGPPEFVYTPTLPLEPYRGMPYMPRPVMYTPVVDSSVFALLLQQIDYYFSDANLVKDVFLRSNMDDQGWVPISLVANFPRVKILSTNIQLIVESLRASTTVEVQDDKIRRQNGWKKWVTHPNLLGNGLSSLSPRESGNDRLVTSFQRVGLDEEGRSQSMTASDSNRHNEVVTEKESSESAGHSQVSNGDVNQDAQSDL